MSEVVIAGGKRRDNNDRGTLPITLAPQYKDRLRVRFIYKIKDLPTVDCTLDVTHKVYRTIKRSTCITNFFFKKIENIIINVEDKVLRPIVLKYKNPIKKIDQIICLGLDYVEENVPCVKQHPKEMLSNTAKFISNTPCVKSSRQVLSICYGENKKRLQ